MPKKPHPAGGKSRKPAAGITPLPSLPKWEDPWERRVDLASLRARKPYFENLRRLAEDERHDGEAPSVESEKIKELIGRFGLDNSRRDRLAEDARLIAEWYLAPKLEKRVRLGHDRYFAELEEAAERAEACAASFEVSAVQLEHIVNSVLPSSAYDEDLDLLSLKRQLNQFLRRAQTVLDERSGAGRKKDERRNGALALIAWAIEETHYQWRAVDHEGEILESSVTKKRDKKAGLQFFKRTLKRHGSPVEILPDGLKS